ncbi:MAG: hypothetical protein IAF94_16280 [Pirellulaceae bacterium]|nr:hypothetical protein [Pirellulaceae bacterium]
MLRSTIFTVAFCLAICQNSLAEPGLRIVRDKSGHAVAFEAAGLPVEQLAKMSDESLGQLLALYVVDKSANQQAADLPSLLGKFEVDDDTLRFTPQFALLPGTRYRAVLQAEVLEGKRTDPKNAVTLEIALAAPKRAAATVVSRIFPSSDKLPENQLRFYLHFSQPMTKGEAYTHLKLLKENGEAIELPFLELGEELWDARSKRLTLLIDPGRIKRGLKPREDVGPVLEAGQAYTLVVDAAWKDAAGEPLQAEFSKRFVAEKPVEVGIETAAWRIEPPAANTRQPLALKFPRPLDHALLHRTIVILDAAGKAVAGEIAVTQHERQWGFTPADPWESGDYSLEVDKVLEDVAGNRIGRAFELAEGETVKQTGPRTVRIPFVVAVRPSR